MCLLGQQAKQKAGKQPFGPRRTQAILSNPNNPLHNYLDPNTRMMDFDRYFSDRNSRREQRRSNGLFDMVQKTVDQTQQQQPPTNRAPHLFSNLNRGANYGSIYKDNQSIYK